MLKVQYIILDKLEFDSAVGKAYRGGVARVFGRKLTCSLDVTMGDFFYFIHEVTPGELATWAINHMPEKLVHVFENPPYTLDAVVAAAFVGFPQRLTSKLGNYLKRFRRERGYESEGQGSYAGVAGVGRKSSLESRSAEHAAAAKEAKSKPKYVGGKGKQRSGSQAVLYQFWAYDYFQHHFISWLSSLHSSSINNNISFITHHIISTHLRRPVSIANASLHDIHIHTRHLGRGPPSVMGTEDKSLSAMGDQSISRYFSGNTTGQPSLPPPQNRVKSKSSSSSASFSNPYASGAPAASTKSTTTAHSIVACPICSWLVVMTHMDEHAESNCWRAGGREDEGINTTLEFIRHPIIYHLYISHAYDTACPTTMVASTPDLRRPGDQTISRYFSNDAPAAKRVKSKNNNPTTSFNTPYHVSDASKSPFGGPSFPAVGDRVACLCCESLVLTERMDDHLDSDCLLYQLEPAVDCVAVRDDSDRAERKQYSESEGDVEEDSEREGTADSETDEGDTDEGSVEREDADEEVPRIKPPIHSDRHHLYCFLLLC
ncbi:hypothetical protein LTR10_000379 [Elasticomyces elasticus]|nr:hypothetical protein LTR10_000379 [Elasticomyces elasticus]KAK4980369.1 hypothetical protein LTR42_000676 [Elasticomyces elasticus]